MITNRCILPNMGIQSQIARMDTDFEINAEKPAEQKGPNPLNRVGFLGGLIFS